MSSIQTIIETECSDGWCRQPLTIDTEALTVTVAVPFTPDHVTVDATQDRETDLIMWDCPACGYADSYDVWYE